MTNDVKPVLSAEGIIEAEKTLAEARRQRIETLVQDRTRIDSELKLLGYAKPKPGRPRGSRNKKVAEGQANG